MKKKWKTTLHRTWRRALSLLLAVCVLAGTAPMPSRAAGSREPVEETGLLESVIYDFTACQAEGHTLQDGGGIDSETGAIHADLDSHDWELNQAESTDSTRQSWAMGPSGFVSRAAQAIASAGQAQSLALNIQVPASGDYDLSVFTSLHQDGGVTEVYIDGEKLGSYDSYQADAAELIPAEELSRIGRINLSQGAHVVEFRLIERFYIIPRKLVLAPAFDGFVVDFTECAILGHETQDFVNQSGWNTADHATLETHGWQINNDESQTSAYINRHLGRTGFLGYSPRWLQPGDSSREPRYITFDVAIPKTGVYKVSLITGKHSIGGSTEFYVNGRMLGTYDSYDASITDHKDLALNSGNIRLDPPIEMGTALLTEGVNQVKFRLIWRNYIIPSRIIFTPVGESTELDFTACTASGHDADPMHATVADHGWAIDPEKTAGIDQLAMSEYGIAARSDTDASAEKPAELGLTFRVPETGFYLPALVSAGADDGGRTQLLIDGVEAASYSSQSAEPTAAMPGVQGNVVYLQAGEHSAVYRLTENRAILPAKLDMLAMPQDGVDVDLSLDGSSAVLAPGGSARFTAKATVNQMPLSVPADAHVQVYADSAAAAGTFTRGDAPDTWILDVTGGQEGKCTLTARVFFGNISMSSELDVRVVGEASEPLVYDFTTCYAQGHGVEPSHATLETHAWQLDESASTPFTAAEMTQSGLHVAYENALSPNNKSTYLNIYVPKSGYYTFYNKIAAYDAACFHRTFVDGAQLSGFGGAAGPGTENLLGKIFLAKGEHAVQFLAISGTGFTLEKLTFVPEKILKGDLSLRVDPLASLTPGGSQELPISLRFSNGGTEIKKGEYRIGVENPQVLQAEVVIGADGVSQSLRLTGLAEGVSQVSLQLIVEDAVMETAEVFVQVTQPVFTAVQLKASSKIIAPDAEGESVSAAALDQNGAEMDMGDAYIHYESLQPDTIAVDEHSGRLTPVSPGAATIRAAVTMEGKTIVGELAVVVKSGKTESTYYTAEKVAAVRDNAEKYDWARSEKQQFIDRAEKFIGQEEKLWNMVTTQELPRSLTVGWRLDPDAYTCRYPECRANLRVEYGLYPWKADPLNDPYKIQCPACRRKFPSNDFESFYKLGIDEGGNWSYQQALDENQKLVDAGQDGYLVNTAFPEVEGMTDEYGTVLHNWGVDDGWGYRPGRTFTASNKTIEEAHSYIAYYNHWWLWMWNWHTQGVLRGGLSDITQAYLYTGDKRYGRVGAILVDRIADVYPDMYTEPYNPAFFPIWKRGKAVDMTWESESVKIFAQAYDLFYDLYEDPQVISFLSQKAKKYHMSNTKDSAELIRANCEDGILREIYKAAVDGDINGNFAMHQTAVANAAVILDTMPDTQAMIDWIFQDASGSWGGGSATNDGPPGGGHLIKQLVDNINRDGTGNESSPSYNNGWLANVKPLADIFAGYQGYEEADLYNHPKFVKMFSGNFPLTLCRRETAAIADSGSTASTGIQVVADSILSAFYHTKRPEFAQYAYFLNGNTSKGLHYDMFTPNSTRAEQDVQAVINTYGEYDFDASSQMAGYGFTALRGGSLYEAAEPSKTVDTQRDFWIYYGIGAGHGGKHGHHDGLNLGIDAFGLNLAPDFGYPEAMDGSDKVVYWECGGIGHNTVQVDRQWQQNTIVKNGEPLHFDDSGRVKLMDVRSPDVYNVTDEYRRTVVMVDASDEASYGVDFFRVIGGNDHAYAFHTTAGEVADVQGVTLTPQVDGNNQFVGTLAGPDVPWGSKTGDISGYSWLKNVRKDAQPKSGEFSIDFAIEDFRKLLPTERDIHLRMTMLNDFTLSEVALTAAVPPQRSGNPESVELVVASRRGANLDSLFTTVYEPYDNERYIESMKTVPITVQSGTPGLYDTAKAIKVTLKNGREDYIVYATNNQVLYRVDGVFDFRGFVGVYSLAGGTDESEGKSCVYSYLSDGDVLEEITGDAAYTGVVQDFTSRAEL